MWLSILLFMSLFVQPGIECSENGDLSNVSGEARLPADIKQRESCVQDNARVCQGTQVRLLLCSLPVLITRVLHFNVVSDSLIYVSIYAACN